MGEQEQNLDLTYASSIENIDFAIYDWLDKTLNLSCDSREGFKKVPVIWVTPERAFQVKQNKEFRDVNGTLNIPMITVERTNITKDVKENGTYFTNIQPRDNRHIISKRINQKKTSEFANADRKKRYGEVLFAKPKRNEKVVYEFKSMLLPVYATFTYNISILTQFQQQMNELVQPFISKTGSSRYFLVERDGYKYECFIDGNLDSKNNISSMEEEERRYVTNITIKVLGNLISSGKNENDTIIRTFENAVEIKIPKEKIILEDISSHKDKIKEISAPIGGNTASLVCSNVAIKKVFKIGNGVDSQYVINHNLETRDMYISVRENFGPDYSQITAGIIYTDLNFLTVDMGDPIETDSYIVTIIG